MTPPSPTLPDLFTFTDGRPVRTAQDWERRRPELLDALLSLEYGPMPAPAPVVGEPIHSHTIHRLGGMRHEQYRLEVGGCVHMLLDLLIPPGEAKFPVILNGDGCWRYLSDEISVEVVRRGYILAQFNRLEVMADNAGADAGSPLYRLFPGKTFGALAAWAWSYHRCVDCLSTLAHVAAAQIAITGHSRGGKTTLLAAATDPRIALANANASGCGGASCFHAQAEGSETIANILKNFPQWFGPRFAECIGREGELPFDQHFAAALVAPRALLFTEAMGDLWANPSGVWHTFIGARKAYRFLGVEPKLGIAYRQGGHAHSAQDWSTLLEFADWHFHGARPSRSFEFKPFEG